MQFIVTSSEIKNDVSVSDFFERLRTISNGRQGYCYYKYPVAGGFNSYLPDITICDLEYGICLFNFCSYTTLNDIEEIDEYEWKIKSQNEDSPILQLEDYVTNLKSKYEKYRPLRNRVKINFFVVFPSIKRSQFSNKFQEYDIIDNCIFSDQLNLPYDSYFKTRSNFIDKDIKSLFLSVTQGAGRLNDFKRLIEGVKSDKIGDAIKLIDTKIAYLDNQQHAAAIQIPDGPQRIRGMAGTGKTIILTMKAAFLHSRYPEKKILYTFHTQSLYNQIRDLITKFYRETEEKDPNWNNLLIMHSWGGRAKEGVYSRACLKNSIEVLPFSPGGLNSDLNYVCSKALENKINPEYDFVLMDEAQDFPPTFYQLIFQLTTEPKRIIFAYDELQSLNKLSVSDTGDLFGYHKDGTKIVDFSKGSYDGNIEMDYVLYKSYRNPLKVLMTAHSIGLGLYNEAGYMQVINDVNVWKAIGYEVIKGSLQKTNENIEIKRPTQNSISIANELYSGERESLETQIFDTRADEIKWIADQIENDVKDEKVEPHDIVVISINQKSVDNEFISLQSLLHQKGIPSIIPGVGGIERDKFGEKGFVTLSTVYKAKGNEAFIVYVMAFDFLYNYDFIFTRNRAFTSISRSKGWCRITGKGANMERAITEIGDTINNIPFFKFKFPEPKKIQRKLSQEEHARKLEETRKVTSALKDLLTVEDSSIDLSQFSAEEIEALKKKLGSI